MKNDYEIRIKELETEIKVLNNHNQCDKIFYEQQYLSLKHSLIKKLQRDISSVLNELKDVAIILGDNKGLIERSLDKIDFIITDI